MNPMSAALPGASKSAQTRFMNDRSAAKQASVLGNNGAKQVFKRTTQALQRPAQSQQRQAQEVQGAPQEIPGGQGVPPPAAQAQFFTQNPVANQPPGPEFDPDVFVRNELDKIIADRKLERVMSSPEVHASISRIKLQDHFKRNEPMGTPSQATTSQRVLGNLQPFADGR